MSVVVKLDCCTPTSYDAGSRFIMHAEWCEVSPAEGVTREEWLEMIAKARSMQDHPTSNRKPLPESWVIEHDRLYPFGCGLSSCYRCGTEDDYPPYGEGV